MRIAYRHATERQECTITSAFIHQLMRIWMPFWKGGHIPRLHQHPTIFLDQRRFAAQHDDKFILVLMPVALRRGCPRFQDDVANTEIGKSGCRAKPTHPAFRDRYGEGRRIAGAISLLHGCKIDLGHDLSLPLAKALAFR